MNTPVTSASPVGVELVTGDLDAAADFYAGLLGWTGTATADGVTAHAGGVAAAELRRGPAPARWWTVFGAADPGPVRAAAERAGAHVDGDEVRDPLGAGFRLRAGVTPVAAGPGRPSWYEYMTGDPATADRFHADALGLRTTVPPGAPDDSYALLGAGGPPVAGRLALPPPLRDLLPAGWMVYFAVADPDDTAERARQRGGRVLVPPSDVATGRVCALADPAGAVFTVIRPGQVGG
ncbi:VOC family protein [Micromonospora mirobrigensis]|uniref:VOC domain-containing protein n=1 Tax=Micromonospora mirobrigensis TaxID=262898 RepID=A0A1C4WVW0_9ACTN|nr:VOC family protein [Micromonospora mirobrigensis]SCF00362.1 hypothetical protein GA0070564_102548 [Micromonospora mirobrigensis]